MLSFGCLFWASNPATFACPWPNDKYVDSTHYKNPLESDSSKSVDSTDYKNPLESDSSKSAVTADYKNPLESDTSKYLNSSELEVKTFCVWGCAI